MLRRAIVRNDPVRVTPNGGSDGVLWHDASAEAEEVYLSVLRKAFNDLGYIEGKNI